MIEIRKEILTDLSRDVVVGIVKDSRDFNFKATGNKIIAIPKFSLMESQHSTFKPIMKLDVKEKSNRTLVAVVCEMSRTELVFMLLVNLINLVVIALNLLGIELIQGYMDFDFGGWIHLGFLMIFNIMTVIGHWLHSVKALGIFQELLNRKTSIISPSQIFWDFQTFRQKGKKP